MFRKKPVKGPTLLSCPFCGLSFEDVTSHLDECEKVGGKKPAPAQPKPSPPPTTNQSPTQVPAPVVAQKPLPAPNAPNSQSAPIGSNSSIFTDHAARSLPTPPRSHSLGGAMDTSVPPVKETPPTPPAKEVPAIPPIKDTPSPPPAKEVPAAPHKPKPFVPEKPPVLGGSKPSPPEEKPKSFTQGTLPRPQPTESATRQLSDSATSDEGAEQKPIQRPTPPPGRGRGGRGSVIRGLGMGRGNSSNEIQRGARTTSIDGNQPTSNPPAQPPPPTPTQPSQSPDVSGNNSVNDSEDSQEQESLDSASVEDKEEKPQSAWARKVVPNTNKRKTLIDRTLMANTSSVDSEEEPESEPEPETFFITIFDHPPQNDGEINLVVGDIVTLVERTTHEWFYVRLGDVTGYVAAEYVELYVPGNDNSSGTTSTENEEIMTRPRKPTQPTTPAPSIAPNFHANRSNSPGGSAIMPNRTVNLGPQKKSSKFATLRFPTKKKKEKEFTISRSDEITISRADTAPNLQRTDSVESPTNSVETPVVEVEQVDQRTKIVREILSTEQHYVKILKTMIEKYKETLLYKQDLYQKEVTKDNINDIFINVELIYKINNQLLSEIEKVVNDWKDTSIIGDVFHRTAPFLKMYNQYSNKYDNALATLGRCCKNENFSGLVEEIDQTTGLSSRLEGLLIAPVQRIPRYTLLLQELKRHTPQDHPDVAHLEKAIPLMQEVADYINNNMKQVENQAKLISLSLKGAQSLLKPHRQLLNEGIVNETKYKKLHIWLFNDIFVHIPDNKAKNKSNLNKPKFQWPLHLVWLGEKSKKYKNTFTLMGPTCQYQISAEDIDVWIRQFEHAIKQHFEYLAVTQDIELKKEKEANMSYDNPMRYGTYEFPTCESFSGWWKDGKFEGLGRFEFFGNVHEGTFKEGLREGHGIMTYCSGDIFEGEWSNDKQNGPGSMTYANGDVFSGNFLEGKKHGKGEFRTLAGDSYIGEWADDQPQGLGEMFYSNGLIYNGNWENGLRHHYGILITPHGERYEGEWVCGVRNGKGRMEYAEGFYYDGYWRDGCYHGQGSLHSPSGVYEGEWVYDEKEGNGTMKYPNGKEYKGQWKRNEYHGTGTLTYVGGTIESYTGEWQYHKKTGSGVLKLANGDVYEGHFKDNFMHGTGCYTWKCGVSLKGKWVKNKVVGECIYTLNKTEKNMKKNQFVYQGVYKDGKIIASDRPAIYIPQIPAFEIDLL